MINGGSYALLQIRFVDYIIFNNPHIVISDRSPLCNVHYPFFFTCRMFESKHYQLYTSNKFAYYVLPLGNVL